MRAALPSWRGLSLPLGAVARLAHGSSGSTHSCQLHPLPTWQQWPRAGHGPPRGPRAWAAGVGGFAQGRRQQASPTLGAGGWGRWA